MEMVIGDLLIFEDFPAESVMFDVKVQAEALRRPTNPDAVREDLCRRFRWHLAWASASARLPHNDNPNKPAMMDKRLSLRRGGMLAAFFFALCALIFFRFRDVFPSVFYGDDLAMFMYTRGGGGTDPHIAALLSYIASSKFRPLFTAVLGLETYLFGKTLGPYHIVNVLINAVGGIVASAVFFQHSGSRVVSALFAATLVASRFAVYQVTQVTGQVESISFVFFVATVFFASKAVVDVTTADVKRDEWIALLFAAFAFHTHERYVVVLPWLLLVFFLTRKEVGRRHRLAVLGVAIAVLMFNVGYKRFVLHSAFFEGTGGQQITISFPSVVDLASQAALSIFGLNTGPDYLVGTKWTALTPEYQSACIVFAIVALLSILAAVVRSVRTGRAVISFPWLLVLAAGLVTAPATMTIRMEQRWELAPFFILLTLVSVCIGQQARRQWCRVVPAIVVVLLFGSHIAIEFAVSASFPKIFFVNEATYARAVKDRIIGNPAIRTGENVVLIAEASHCAWGLLSGHGLFDFYEGRGRSATCVKDSRTAGAIAGARPIFASVSPSKLIDVTRQIRRRRGPNIDLFAKFNNGDIVNTTPEDTPTHAGVFERNWDWLLGNQKTLVVLSTHGLVFKDLQSLAPSALSIDAGLLYPLADSSDIVVTIQPHDGSAREIVLKLPRLPPDEKPNTSHFEVPVPELSKGPVNVTLRVRTPSGNLAGAWAGFTAIDLTQTS